MIQEPNETMIADMLAHSFKDFHAKGFDYLCVKRTPAHTRKVYFFDGDVSKLSEVVNPHDHRYVFKTTVLSGVMSNSVYVEDHLDHLEGGQVYQEFEWRTPLNGGNGFTWKRQATLFEQKRFFYRKFDHYLMRPEEFHTIRMHAPGTVLVLHRYADIVPMDQPTRTFVSEAKAPNLDGLYSRFTADEVLARWRQFRGLLA